MSATQSARRSKPGTFLPGGFDNIKTNTAEVAHLLNEAAFDGAVFYADDADKIIRCMERIVRSLSEIRQRLATRRRA